MAESSGAKRPCRRCGGTGIERDDRVIGAAMRARRQRAKRSLRAVASRMGVSPAYVSDLELGKRGWHNDITRRFKEATS